MPERARWVGPRAGGKGGAIVVMVALALGVMLACIGLAIDIGHWYHQWSRLQVAADEAALAGAVDISKNVLSTSDAAAMAKLNGITDSEILTNRSLPAGAPSPTRYEIVLRRTAGGLFSSIVGIGSVVISVRALAQADTTTSSGSGQGTGSTRGVYAYSLFSSQEFSSGTKPYVTVYKGTSSTFGGRVQVNGTWDDEGHSSTFNGLVSAGHDIIFDGNSSYNGGSSSNSPILSMPAVDTTPQLDTAKLANTLYNYDGSAWTQWNNLTHSFGAATPPSGAEFTDANLVFDGNGNTISGTYYVQGGGVILKSANTSGSGTIVASGPIRLDTHNTTWGASSAFGLISLSTASNAIDITGSNTTLNGAFLAPDGGLNFDCSNMTITGGIFVKNVPTELGPSSTTLAYGASSVQMLDQPGPTSANPVYIHLVQ